MGHFWRNFAVLMWKSYIVRKRNWLNILINEIFYPLILLILIEVGRNIYGAKFEQISSDTHYPLRNKKDIMQIHDTDDLIPLYFSPKNTFTEDLIKRTENCLVLANKNLPVEIKGFPSEKELLLELATQEVKKSEKIVAVIFKNSESLDSSRKHLKYKIRSGSVPVNLFHELYMVPEEVTGNEAFIEKTHFLKVQMCLDESFLIMKLPESSLKSEISIQQMPHPPYIKVDPREKEMRSTTMQYLLGASLLYMLIVESQFPFNEKCTGVHILMSMHGIQNYQNLLSWFVSGLLSVLIICIMPIVISSKIAFLKDVVPFLNYGNGLIFSVLLVSHIAHLITFGMHSGAYFSNIIFQKVSIVLFCVIPFLIGKFTLTGTTYDFKPYLGMLFPTMMSSRIFDEINTREYSMVGIHWNNLFLAGDLEYATTLSLGGVFILSILGSLLNFMLALYAYSLFPGKYGVPKHPLYFIQFLRSNRDTPEERVHENDHNHAETKFFEKIPENSFIPGIQIRDLKKSYYRGFLNGEINEVLHGISIDFYKGQITALLGHNGAGKTTMMSIIVGSLSPTRGTIFINGKNTKYQIDQIRSDLGLCPQEDMLFPDFNVFEQMQFLAELSNRNNKTRSELKKEVDALLLKLQLSNKRDDFPSNLSGGQQRKVCFGMAIVSDASTLIFDEPTSGMDAESRRYIWDILLKMRGEKTIIVSTHNMEEADVLGDRTAIIHQGRLACYGTPMFLKKLYGQGNVEVILSTEKGANSDQIMKQLNTNAQLIDVDGGRMIFSVSLTSQLPDNLDKLEERKKELGITGISVSLITLEQVFLKATKEDDNVTGMDIQPEFEKVRGFELFLQMTMALFFKKFKYAQKNIKALLFMVFFPTISIFIIALCHQINLHTNPETHIKLEMYRNAKALYSSNDQLYEQKYKSIVKGYNGIAEDIGTRNISKALLDFGKNDLNAYRNNLITAATIQVIKSEKIYINVLYSGTASFSIPISINLAFNTLIKALISEEYHIDLCSQKHPELVLKKYSEIASSSSLALIYLMCFALSMYVVHPASESVCGIKHLQRMTGVPSWLYLGTLFIFDFIIFMISTMFILLGFYLMDIILDIRLMYATEASIMLQLFSLLAINGLLITYIASFLNMKTSTIANFLLLTPLASIMLDMLGCLAIMRIKDLNLMKTIRMIHKNVFLLIPHVSFYHSQCRFLRIANENAECRRIPNYLHDAICAKGHKCCDLNCFDGKCKKSFDYYQDKEDFPFEYPDDVNLGRSEFFMTLTCFIYFAILIILEHKIIPFLYAKIKRVTDNSILIQYMDDQVKEEKLYVAKEIEKLKTEVNFSDTLQNRRDESLDNNNDAEGPMYLVYKLKKKYGSSVVVRDVNFAVKRGECFGLLGVNGAGKTTTFRMLTGQEFPNSGNVYLEADEIFSNRKKHLSQVGYCPQHTALIDSLNARDHLKLFALLRGIPKSHVASEVEKWIKKLNLSRCAEQASETYSGGNKRRLNAAIAMIGNPKMLLLDEPTTGVDPSARKTFRNVIKSSQLLKQSVVLSSHSMDECDVVCHRLVIMVKGKLVCIGSSQQLKQRFGAGFDINIKLHLERTAIDVKTIKKNIEESLTCTLSDEHMGYITYHVTDQRTKWKTMYRVMENLKKKYDCIEDFTIVTATLEQLFLKFARQEIQQNFLPGNVLRKEVERTDQREQEEESNTFPSFWRTPRSSININLNP